MTIAIQSPTDGSDLPFLVNVNGRVERPDNPINGEVEVYVDYATLVNGHWRELGREYAAPGYGTYFPWEVARLVATRGRLRLVAVAIFKSLEGVPQEEALAEITIEPLRVTSESFGLNLASYLNDDFFDPENAPYLEAEATSFLVRGSRPPAFVPAKEEVFDIGSIWTNELCLVAPIDLSKNPDFLPFLSNELSRAIMASDTTVNFFHPLCRSLHFPPARRSNDRLFEFPSSSCCHV